MIQVKEAQAICKQAKQTLTIEGKRQNQG